MAVFFVERTPGGQLATMLKSEEDRMSPVFQKKIRIVEKSGTKLSDILTTSNPCSGENCYRKKCLLCIPGEDEGTKCKTRSVVYTNTCLNCKAKGKTSMYVGETGRSGVEMMIEHHRDERGKNADDKSHMRIHTNEVHPESPNVKWKFKVEKRFQSAFYRQISECIMIRRKQQGGALILNKKEEYSRSILPQLEVSLGGKLLEKQTTYTTNKRK